MRIGNDTSRRYDGVLPWSWETGGQQRLTLFYARFDAHLFDPARFGRAGIVRPENIARSVAKRQAEFFFGRLCAMAGLDRLGMPGIEVAVGERREPVWPAGVIGSISHCRTTAAALVLPARSQAGAGIDIEEVISEPSRLQALMGTVVFPPELARLEQVQGGWDWGVLLTLVFSAKESFFKGAYLRVNRIFDFDALEFVRIDGARSTMVFEVREHLCDAFRPGQLLQVNFTMFDSRHVLTAFLG
ncbi:4'-phosphopantetheinyl transferase superfamily protein [Pseudoduganella sp. LjRoot289]|uniref:4'-phosphopantetheinyl transferase family protein n=1 Tax=Pseudoduganella sp. LjRoot289 TaxID=3342314 RepID=UPI003ECF0A10